MSQHNTNKKPLNIVNFSYDWRNLFQTDLDMVLNKYNRDQLNTELNRFFVICWSSVAYEKRVTDTIYTVHLRAKHAWFKPLYDFLLFFKAKKSIQQHGFKPDIILVYEAPLLPAAYRVKRALGGKVVFCLTNLPIEYSSTRRYGYVKAVYSWFFLKMAGWFTDYVYTINNVVKEYILQHTSISESNVRIFVSDTIKQDIARGDAIQKGSKKGDYIRKKHALTSQYIIFSVGRIQSEKGFENLFTALASLKKVDCQLVIAGGKTNEKYYQKLSKLLEELGLEKKVFFIGELSRNEIWRYYCDADAFILLSKAEALGLVFWEAMYAGCPVMGSRVSGIIESLGTHEERGYLWDEKDGVEQFEKKLQSMLEKTSEVQDQLLQAKKYVEGKITNNYSINDLAEEIL